GGSAVSPIKLVGGAAISTPAAPTRSGYTFDGWDPVLPATMPQKDLTVVAKWKANPTPTSAPTAAPTPTPTPSTDAPSDSSPSEGESGTSNADPSGT
ncbi:MAG TPA: InlB B-repeat-containing protein, partial [Clostridiaceae bacterium]|nr:InlB B-repeat-containing protein [Clostridiaceae bacterium]